MNKIDIDKILNGMGENLSSMTMDTYNQMVKMIVEDGLSPQKSQKQIKEALSTINEQSAEIIAKSLSDTLNRSFSTKYVKDFEVDGVKLSQRLYKNSKNVEGATKQVINKAIKENKTIAEVSKLLYEGYDFKVDPLDVKKNKTIPKWLKEELNKEPSQRSFKQASSIKTPALRAAYTNALKSKTFAEQQQELKRAFYEKSRYYANRIAQNEVMKAYSVERAKTLLEDESIEVVRVRMSQTHPRVDICDYHATVDKFGLGKGVYPKKLAPIAPFHPFCRCRIVEKVTMSDKDAVFNPNADRELMDRFNRYEKSLIVGSQRRVDKFLKSGDVLESAFLGNPTLVMDVGGVKALGYNSEMKEIEDNIVSNFENIKDDTYGKFGEIWQSENHFESHINKRLMLGHITDKDDYINKTIACLGSSQEYVLAKHKNSWDNICYNSDKSWAVIFNENGKMMTSYKIEPTNKSFENSQKSIKAKIKKGATNEKFRNFFKRLRS